MSLLACFLTLLAAPETSGAPRRRVILMRPARTDAVTVEVLARVSGELAAAGFDVSSLPIDQAQSDRRKAVESVGSELNPIAAFAIFPGPDEGGASGTAEIWVSDRTTGRATVQRLVVDPRDAKRGAAVLAVEAVELLKASLAEVWVSAAHARAPTAPPQGRGASSDSPLLAAARTDLDSARPVHLDGLGVELVAALLTHPGGFGPIWSPALRLSMGLTDRFAGRLSVLGLGQSLSAQNSAGTALVRQRMALAELIRSFRPSQVVQATLSVSAGAYQLAVAGSGTPPLFQDNGDSTWAFAAGAGAGLVVAWGSHAALVADAQVLGFLPDVAVRLGPAEIGHAGRPALLFMAGVRGRL